MASIKRQLKELKGDNKLKDHVIRYILKNYPSEDEIRGFLDDVLSHGCQSGIVGELIYYSDTTRFFKRHQDEINELLKEIIDSTGLSMAELFRDFDQEDPLVLDYPNQNLLAWFGFEETIRAIEAEVC